MKKALTMATLLVALSNLSGGCGSGAAGVVTRMLCQCRGISDAPKPKIGLWSEIVVEPTFGKLPGPCGVNTERTINDVTSRGHGDYYYDKNGRFMKIVNESGQVAREYSFDAGGKMTMETSFSVGQLISIVRYGYDRDCNFVSAESYNSGNGKADSIVRMQYDSRCHRLMSELDSDGDGIVNQRTVYVYTADNRLVQEIYDYNNDSKPERFVRYQYDGSGRKTLEEYEFNGEIEVRITYSYDTHGRLILMESDDGGDGTVEYSHQYYYDESGNPVDENGVPIDDGKKYDADGNLLSEEYGTPGQNGYSKAVYDYSCWQPDGKGGYVDTRNQSP